MIFLFPVCHCKKLLCHFFYFFPPFQTQEREKHTETQSLRCAGAASNEVDFRNLTLNHPTTLLSKPAKSSLGSGWTRHSN